MRAYTCDNKETHLEPASQNYTETERHTHRKMS